MIPEENRAEVSLALGKAFGVTDFEDIRKLNNGLSSALVFRIVVRGTPFLLRVITRKNLQLGPERQYACMSAAAGAGLAPRVWYAGIEDRVCITDFVQPAPFSQAEATVRVAAALRELHALPPFPAGIHHLDTSCMFLMHEGAARDAFLQRIQGSNILAADDYAQLLAWHADLARVLPRDQHDFVSSHNDLKPENIVFDGRRVWLVDWEAAFFNDRYSDLAVMANYLVTRDSEEDAYLETYFGRPPGPYQRARFFLMRQLVHMFYATVFQLLGAPAEPNSPAPEFDAFHHRIWTGATTLENKQARTIFGKLHWDRLVRNTQQARWNESLRIVAASPAAT